MPDDVITLKELLWGQQVTENLHASLIAAIRGNSALTGAALLHPVVDEAQQALDEVLNISLGDILTSAWVTAGKLREAADPAHHPPDEFVRIPMLKHTIRSKQEPALDFTVNRTKVGSLQFTAELTVELTGVVLRVKASRIREVAAGSATATATLSIGEAKLAERKTPDIALPFRMRLGEGIPIPVPHRAQK